jgi:hypothetical protein
MKIQRWLIASLAVLAGLVCAQTPPPLGAPWVADLGDGRYRNPVLHTDYSDPDVIRVGDRFYMTASSFTNVPGLPLLESPDLVNWTNVSSTEVSNTVEYTVPTGSGKLFVRLYVLPN